MVSKCAAHSARPIWNASWKRTARAVDQFGDQQLPAMPVEPPQGLAHHVDRHDPGDESNAFRASAPQVPRTDLRPTRSAHRAKFPPPLRVRGNNCGWPRSNRGRARSDGLEPRAFVAVGHLCCDHGLAAAGLGVGGIEPLQRMGHAGAQFGEVAQLLFRQGRSAGTADRKRSRSVRRRSGPRRTGVARSAQIEVIGLGQPQQDLRGHRAAGCVRSD